MYLDFSSSVRCILSWSASRISFDSPSNGLASSQRARSSRDWRVKGLDGWLLLLLSPPPLRDGSLWVASSKARLSDSSRRMCWSSSLEVAILLPGERCDECRVRWYQCKGNSEKPVAVKAGRYSCISLSTGRYRGTTVTQFPSASCFCFLLLVLQVPINKLDNFNEVFIFISISLRMT